MLRGRIVEGRNDVLDAWFERIIGGYPDETSQFLRSQRDPFHNPVGAALRSELAALLDAVASQGELADLEPCLDRIVRIRALQDMSPSAAVGFMPVLKQVLREVLPGAETDRVEIEDQIDQMALLTFDVYCRCRDAVADIRVEAIRNRSIKVMERFNAWAERREASRTDSGGPEERTKRRALEACVEEGGGS